MRRAFKAQPWTLFTGIIICGCLVSDGWSGKPSPLLHQILLLPVTLITGALLVRLLFFSDQATGLSSARLLTTLGVFEVASLAFIAAEADHFKRLGYESVGWQVCLLALVAVGAGLSFRRTHRGLWLILGALVVYALAMLLAVYRFPLNYLRSDMLPVIGWADTRLLHGLNPYSTIHVGARLYDFPYLPGVLVAFVPLSALHGDLRLGNLLYLCAAMSLIYMLARTDSKVSVAACVSMFVLCPFLQYRHDLYLQPHWFTLVLAVYLQRRGKNSSAAFVWGVSCAIYQLSWVIIPFFLLQQIQSRGFRSAAKAAAIIVLGAGVVTAPFLSVAAKHIANNTVGQWNHMSHALADPMNLSYWVTYIVPPSDLRWVQAGAMLGIFGFCVVRRRCQTQTDMLRWMTGALALFVALNVLVDGYFYLTVLLLLTMYFCSSNGWWSAEDPEQVLEQRTLLG